LSNLPVIFLKAGYSTACFTNNPLIDHFYGFGHGFERLFKILKPPEEKIPFKNYGFVQFKPNKDFTKNIINTIKLCLDKPNMFTTIIKKIINSIIYYNLNYYGFLQQDKGLQDTINRMKEWINNTKKPFFIFANIMETHEMYLPFCHHNFLISILNFNELLHYLKEVKIRYFTSRNLIEDVKISEKSVRFLRRLYLNEIKYMDRTLKSFYDFLEDRRLIENTILVITSDHGQELYEHKALGHPIRFYNTILHVPLFLSIPEYDSLVIDSFVSVKDVFKTLTYLALGYQRSQIINGKLIPPFGRDLNFALSETLGDPVFEMKLRNPNSDNELNGIPLKILRDSFFGGVSVYFKNYHYFKLTNGHEFLFDFEKDYLENNNILDQKNELIPEDILKLVNWRVNKIKFKNLRIKIKL